MNEFIEIFGKIEFDCDCKGIAKGEFVEIINSCKIGKIEKTFLNHKK